MSSLLSCWSAARHVVTFTLLQLCSLLLFITVSRVFLNKLAYCLNNTTMVLIAHLFKMLSMRKMEDYLLKAYLFLVDQSLWNNRLILFSKCLDFILFKDTGCIQPQLMIVSVIGPTMRPKKIANIWKISLLRWKVEDCLMLK